MVHKMFNAYLTGVANVAWGKIVFLRAMRKAGALEPRVAPRRSHELLFTIEEHTFSVLSAFIHSVNRLRWSQKKR